MTAALLTHDIQTRRILHAVQPKQCPEADCTLFYDAAVADRCNYHYAREADRLRGIRRHVCLYEGCGLETSRPDPYGLCSVHAATPPRGSREVALAEIRDTYGLHMDDTVQETPPMVISRADYRRAVGMIEDLDAIRLGKLCSTPPAYPDTNEWQSTQVQGRMPRWIAGVARAVAVGSYIIQEDM